MSLRHLKTIEERRKFIEQKLNLQLDAISIYPPNLKEAQHKNCENMIGATQLPLGIAGPIKINGQAASGNFYLPLATTEAALVASVNRGCKVITASGGASCFSVDVGITRGPVFKTRSLSQSLKLKLWLEKNLSKLKSIAQTSSSHLKLIAIDIKIVGINVFVRFSYHTEEAMGMNMITIATDKIVVEIEKQTGTSCIALAGNYDIDKKPAFLNFLKGRGKSVWAEVILKEKVVNEILKTTTEKIHQVAIKKCLLGSIVSGSLGFNAHYANILAALFIACGQDVAHIAEGSIGITTTELIDNNLEISVYLPDLPVGVIGGGTYLPSQKEALKILGVAKVQTGEKTKQFAEIIGSSVLAGEISLLASLAAGTLAKSHLKLARGKKLK